MMIICTNFVIIYIKILIQRKFKNMIIYLKLWWNLKSKEFFMVFMNYNSCRWSVQIVVNSIVVVYNMYLLLALRSALT